MCLIYKDGEKKEAMYFVNYKNGGFAIISGDKRVNPILAYSEKNQLPTKTSEQIPGGLAAWIGQTAHRVDKLRSNKAKGTTNRHDGWQALLNDDQPGTVESVIEPPDEPPCETNGVTVGPFLDSEWGQADGYNNFSPNYGCDYPYNGKAFTGCVATAIAQVMRYHEVPQFYDWQAMPDEVLNINSYNADVISGLMFNIGEEVDMEWGCIGADYDYIDDGSGADDDDINNAFQSFGYPNAHQIGYEGTDNYEIVESELDANRPVVFSGCDKRDIIGIFPAPDGCHAWVGDGYTSGTYCPSGNTYLLFHMNWGWNGSYNGFYGLGHFEPGDHDYDYKSEVVVGIQP